MSQPRLADRVERVITSPSAIASQRARELRAEGVDMIALSSGEPDFQPPPHVVEAAHAAMLAGQTKYTTMSGTPELKRAIVEKFARENGLAYETGEVIVSAGAKQVIFNAIMATVERGDQVIIPAPFWIAYEQIVRMAGGTPVIVPCSEDAGFKLTADQLAEAITPRTRWLMLNSPSNPSGAVYTVGELTNLAGVLEKNPGVWIMTDDIYEHIVFDNRSVATIAVVAPSLKSRTLTVNGVSKTYAMTGFRIGYGCGPKLLIDAMLKVQSQSTSGASSVSQAAALAALTGPQDVVAERCAAFEERRDLVVSMLNQTNGITCRRPEGAFYVFPNCAGLIGKRTPDGGVIETDQDFVMYVMNSFNVTTVQGSAYGLSPYFRISIASSLDDLRRGCERIQETASSLR